MVNASDTVPAGDVVTESKDGTVAQVDVPTRGSGTDAASTKALNELRDRSSPRPSARCDGATANVTGDAAASAGLRVQAQQPAAADLRVRLRARVRADAGDVPVARHPASRRSCSTCSPSAPPTAFSCWSSRTGTWSRCWGSRRTAGSRTGCRCSCSWCCSGSRWTTTCSSCRASASCTTRGMSTEDAVREGISTTAGTVTSAAVVMVGVFAVFVTLELHRLQGARARTRRGGPDRRDDHPRRAAAGVDDVARRLELVPAELAPVAAARRRRSRGRSRRPPTPQVRTSRPRSLWASSRAAPAGRTRVRPAAGQGPSPPAPGGAAANCCRNRSPNLRYTRERCASTVATLM